MTTQYYVELVSFILVLAAIFMFQVSCTSTKADPTILAISQRSRLGMTVWSNGTNQSVIDQLDLCYEWAKSHGLSSAPENIEVCVVVGELTPVGNYGIRSPASPTGWEGGQVMRGDKPWMIRVMEQSPDNLRHELYHVILWEKYGNYDTGHSRAEWKQLGIF